MAYSKEEKDVVLKSVFERISKGNALRNILNEKGMPSYSTFYIWISEDEEKSKQYVRACEERQDFMFEEMLEIADKQGQDVTIDKDGKEVINHNVIQRSRLMIDTRKWALSKLNPKKYGDKIDHTSGGEKIQHTAPQLILPGGQTMEDVKQEMRDILKDGGH